MRGSYLAKVIDEELKREKRRQEMIFKRKCKRCKNKETDLCHVTQDIEGKLKCVNYEVEQNT
jgi:hypothetical protein